MGLPSQVVIATHNAKKGVEMGTILGEKFPMLSLLTLAEFPGAPEPEETGSNYEENALIKSKSSLAFTHLPSLADDAGLEIDALNGSPGLFSKRFGGESMPFAEKMSLILEQMKDVPEEKRTARFRCWIAFSTEEGSKTFEGVLEGVIAKAPHGSGGFGYDPIFYVPELGRTLGDLQPEEKHKISHRGKVLQKLTEYWLSL